MAVKQEPRNGIWYDWLLNDNNWHINMNANLKKLGLMLYLSAKSRSVSTPPGSPANGDVYIVGSSPTGAWSGHTNDVTIWISAESAWVFYTPRTGYLCDIEDEGFLAKWNGSAWVAAGNAPSTLDFREDVVINGRFDLWQEGTSQTTSGYGSDDLWVNNHSGSSKTHSRQAFTLGQTDVPGNPKYFSRTVVTSSAGASNFVAKQQRFEDVTKFSGKTVNFTIWAKADAAKNVAIEFSQYFGTGGSPSATVTGIGVTTLALTTSWQRFVVPVTFPSVSGKTLGTDGNDYSNMAIWLDAGSTFDARTNSLGQQSGTFDLANARGVVGDFPLSDEHWRSKGEELAKVHRYWFKTYDEGTLPGTIANPGRCSFYISGITSADYIVSYDLRYPERMRVAPHTVTLYSDATGTSGVVRMAAGDVAPSSVTPGQTSLTVGATNGAAATTRQIAFHATVDARL